MRYTAPAVKAKFKQRPNRFIALAELMGSEVVCHVKNTGRCRELLLPGAEVWLVKGDNPKRKTPYDLIAVKKGEQLVNIDSQAPNKLAGEYLAHLYPDAIIRPEVKYADSRFDFLLQQGDKKTFVEVKGVTLERDGTAFFPDAPTQRGARHIRELRECLQQGYGAMLLFVVQMKGVDAVRPNADTDPEFALQLRLAAEAGVKLMAVDCKVLPDSMTFDLQLPVIL